MSFVARLVAAFTLSLIVGGALQHLLVVMVMGEAEWGMLLWLAGAVVMVTAAMSLASRRRATLNQVTVLLIVLLTLVGVAALIFGAREQSPGVGGNIMFLVAVLIDIGFLIPAVVAILIHWWLLRPHAKTG